MLSNIDDIFMGKMMIEDVNHVPIAEDNILHAFIIFQICKGKYANQILHRLQKLAITSLKLNVI